MFQDERIEFFNFFNNINNSTKTALITILKDMPVTININNNNQSDIYYDTQLRNINFIDFYPLIEELEELKMVSSIKYKNNRYYALTNFGSAVVKEIINNE